MSTGTTRFSRQNRLLSATAYNRVFRQANKSTDEFFVILWAANGLDRSRLGLAISKKSLKRAVDRNGVKRLVRESFRFHQRLLAGMDLIVLCRRHLPLNDRYKLRNSLERHWMKLANKSSRQLK